MPALAGLATVCALKKFCFVYLIFIQCIKVNHSFHLFLVYEWCQISLLQQVDLITTNKCTAKKCLPWFSAELFPHQDPNLFWAFGEQLLGGTFTIIVRGYRSVFPWPDVLLESTEGTNALQFPQVSMIYARRNNQFFSPCTFDRLLFLFFLHCKECLPASGHYKALVFKEREKEGKA